MTSSNRPQNDIQGAATAAIAAASNTPFKTAFKITLGLALGQLVVALLFMGGCSAIIGTTVYMVVK